MGWCWLAGRIAAKATPIDLGVAWRFFFRDDDRRRRNHGAMGDDVGLVLDNPFDGFAFLELHGFSHSGWEVDVVLVGSLFAGDELDFGWVSHGFVWLEVEVMKCAYKPEI